MDRILLLEQNDWVYDELSGYWVNLVDPACYISPTGIDKMTDEEFYYFIFE